jgi:hypothetical protein
MKRPDVRDLMAVNGFAMCLALNPGAVLKGEKS